MFINTKIKEVTLENVVEVIKGFLLWQVKLIHFLHNLQIFTIVSGREEEKPKGTEFSACIISISNKAIPSCLFGLYSFFSFVPGRSSKFGLLSSRDVACFFNRIVLVKIFC